MNEPKARPSSIVNELHPVLQIHASFVRMFVSSTLRNLDNCCNFQHSRVLGRRSLC